MPYNGSGTFTLVAGNPVVTGTTISSTVHNNTNNDFATGLSTAITKDGQTTLTANIPFAGFAATNVRVRSIDGLVGTPGLTFENDTDCGFYRIGANNIGMALNGAKVMDFSTTQIISAINAGVAATKNFYLDGGGDTYLNESIGNVLDTVVGGTIAVRLTDTTSASFAGYVWSKYTTATPAGGSANAGIFMGSSLFAVHFGSGAPTVSATKGSLYLRSDGSTTNDRAYINTNGGTTWTALVTVA